MPTIISYTTHENLTIPFQRYVIYCMQKKPIQEKFLADIAFAKDVLLLESEAIKNLIDHLDHNFQKAIDLIFTCKGRVVVTGIGKIEEPCPLGLAPSASSTAMLALGDALALTIFKKRNLSKEDYAFYHPGGEL